MAPGKKGLYRFRWNDESGALAQSPNLFPLVNAGAPAAFVNGLLTGVAGNGATFLDADTFTPHVPGSTFVLGPATVAGGLRQMYFLSRYGTLTAVDSNGKVWKNRNLQYGSVAIPALTANHAQAPQDTTVA